MIIWIDLDNTPHVPFFKPIVRALECRGHSVVLTARDAFQVRELAAKMGLTPMEIGRHYGKNRLLKTWGLCWRSLQLLPTVLNHRPDLALSHGSRSQILISNLLKIPTVMLMDYEFAETPWLLQPRWQIVPRVVLEADVRSKRSGRVRTYDGIKEDVYACDFGPDPSLADVLGLDAGQIVVTVRPPATEAHYHNPASDILFAEFMQRLVSTPGTKAVLLPRNKSQEAQIRREFPEWFRGERVLVPIEAVDGLNLLWHSDLVVSGGGTMNREAAALSVPVYSIFRGRIGAVDRHLQKEGRMVLIETCDDVHNKIALRKRVRSDVATPSSSRRVLADIIGHVEEIGAVESGPAGGTK